MTADEMRCPHCGAYLPLPPASCPHCAGDLDLGHRHPADPEPAPYDATLHHLNQGMAERRGRA